MEVYGVGVCHDCCASQLLVSRATTGEMEKGLNVLIFDEQVPCYNYLCDFEDEGCGCWEDGFLEGKTGVKAAVTACGQLFEL